jgi:hypothetical protein
MLCIRHLAANCYFKKVDKNDATGYTVTKLNAGATLIISKPSETGTPNRIIIQEFSPTKDLSISLTGQAEPAPATTLSGDFKKQINDNGTTDTGDDTYEITDATTGGNYVRDTSNGDGNQAGALDLITGTCNEALPVLSRVQFLAQYFSQIAHCHRGVSVSQRISQSVVNQGLITFANSLATLFKPSHHRIIQINSNAGFARWCNHCTTFGIGHIIISFHKISFQMERQALPKLNEHFYPAASSTQQQRALVHQAQPLQNVLHQPHHHLHALMQNHRKTQAQPRQNQRHAFVDSQWLSLGQIQSSYTHNAYIICISQQLTQQLAVNDNEWRVAA